MFLGLRSDIHPAPDLAVSRAFFAALFGVEPYFDEPFYVGFNVGGYELGLDPGADPADGPMAYWGVSDADEAFAALLATGAEAHTAVHEVGGGIRLGSVREPGGGFFGIIENPAFAVDASVTSPGPGR